MNARACAWSHKCRQPLAFKVTSEAWTALVCLNHLGPLCLRAFGRTRSLLVEPVEVVTS